MTPHEFWDEDPCLAVAYREAWEMKQATKSRDMYIQGLYFYEGVCCALSAVVSKHHSDVVPYRSEPIPLTEKAVKAQKERKEREEMEKNKRIMQTLMESLNRKLEAKQNGNNNR